jgi:hypothetical protein
VAACSLVSNHLFRGPLPESTAPRVLLPAARLAELANNASPVRRHGEPPYWNPTADQLRSCEHALWRRVHWSGLHDELGTYLIQYFGVTRRGQPRVVMLGVCPEQLHRYIDEAAVFPVGSFHGGHCEFDAICDPSTNFISNFSVHPGGRR